jgi:hypothetical protein
MKSVAPESAQHSSSPEREVKTHASGEFSLDLAKLPIDDVTDDEADESSGMRMSWMDAGDVDAQRAEACCCRTRRLAIFRCHLSLVRLLVQGPPKGR